MKDQEPAELVNGDLCAQLILHERLLALEELVLSELPRVFELLEEEMQLENEHDFSSVRAYDARMGQYFAAIAPHLHRIANSGRGNDAIRLVDGLSSQLIALSKKCDSIFTSTRQLHGVRHAPEHEACCKQALDDGSAFCREAADQVRGWLEAVIDYRTGVASKLTFVANSEQTP